MRKLHMPRIKQPKRQRQRHFLREWRLYRRLTQEQMALHVQKSRTTYGRTESGQVPYNQDFLELAAAALRCEPVDLLMRRPEDDSALWAIYNKLKKATQEELERALRVLEAVDPLTRTGT